MVEVMGGVVFLFEPAAHDRVLGHVRRQHLDGDEFAGDAMPALVDGAHAALGDLGDDFVIAEDLRIWFECVHWHLPESPSPAPLLSVPERGRRTESIFFGLGLLPPGPEPTAKPADFLAI